MVPASKNPVGQCSVCGHVHELSLGNRMLCIDAMNRHLATIYRDPEFMQQPCRFWKDVNGVLYVGYIETGDNLHFGTATGNAITLTQSSPAGLTPYPFNEAVTELLRKANERTERLNKMTNIVIEFSEFVRLVSNYIVAAVHESKGRCPKCWGEDEHAEGCEVKILLDHAIEVAKRLGDL